GGGSWGFASIPTPISYLPSPRQRDGPTRPQLGPLDDRGRGDQPVRAAPARRTGAAAWREYAARPLGDGQPDRCAARPVCGAGDPRRTPPPIRQGATSSAQGGAYHSQGRRDRGAASAVGTSPRPSAIA